MIVRDFYLRQRIGNISFKETQKELQKSRIYYFPFNVGFHSF